MPIDDMLTAGDSVEEPWARGLPDGQKVLIGSPWQHHGPLCELVSSSSDWCVRMGRHAGDAPVKDCPPGLSVRTQILCSAMSCRWWPKAAGSSALGAATSIPGPWRCQARIAPPGAGGALEGRLGFFLRTRPVLGGSVPGGPGGLDGGMMRAGEMGGSAVRCVPRCWQWSHPDSPDRHDHRHDSAVAREKEETWVLASPVNPSARHVWDPGLARRPRAAGVCFGSPCATQEDRRRGGHRWKGTEGRPDSGHQRRRRIDGVLRAQRACSRGLQRLLCVTTFPCVCICMQSSRRSQGLRARARARRD